MDAGLQARCETFYENVTIIQKEGFANSYTMSALSATMYGEAGKIASREHIKECRTIMKQHAGVFSNVRGIAEPIILAKMALAEDPAAQLEKIQAIYAKEKERTHFMSTYDMVLATNLADKYEVDEVDPVLDKTFAIFNMMNEEHPLLTDKADIGLAGLMAAADLDAASICAEQEKCYQILKEHFTFDKDIPQRISQVLALSPRPADVKVAEFFALEEACQRAGHKLKHGEEIAILSAFVSLEMDPDEVAALIGEVDDWLKDKKGFGALGVGQQLRRMFAGVLVLQEKGYDYGNAASSVTQQVIVTLIITLIIILITVCVSQTVISASS